MKTNHKILCVTVAIITIIAASMIAIRMRDRKPAAVSINSSFITPTDDPNVNMYTSPALGVRFKYAIIDPIFDNKNNVHENGNEISSGGGLIRIFAKDPTKTLSETLKENTPHCKIMISTISQSLEMRASIVFPDAIYGDGTPVRFNEAGDHNWSPNDLLCMKEAPDHVPNYFAASATYPDRYIAVEASTQSPDGALYVSPERHVTLWMSTVEFISKQ